jgi:hypothetical protein
MEWKHFIETNVPVLLRKLSECLDVEYEDLSALYFTFVDGGIRLVDSVPCQGNLVYSDAYAVWELSGHILSLIGGALFGEGPSETTFIVVPINGKTPLVWVHSFYSIGKH